jgi:predicted Fe-Mo cluster-binding NifX family protein
MKKKVLIPLFNEYVAPRFDLATEVLITSVGEGTDSKEKIVMLSKASAEQLCHMILIERIEVLICGGIEDEYYQYLKWKKVEVLDSVVETWKSALKNYSQNTL